MKNSFKTSQILLGLMLLFVSCTQTEVGPITGSALDSKLASLAKKSNFPGFGVAVFSDEKTLYQNSFGYADLENKKPFTTETIQPIASVSKTFVALALMKAIEEGHFTLETNINDILPFKIVNPNFPTKQIKIKHLVTHTSGLLDPEQSIRIKQVYQEAKKPNQSLKDFVVDFYSENGKLYSKNNFDKNDIGTTFNYSNYASALTAYLIEVKTGKSFDEYSQFIFNQLGMKNTHWFHDENKASNYAKLYNPNKQAYPIYTEVDYASSTLKSTINDMSKYMIEMVKGYNGKSTLLKPESFKMLFSNQFEGKASPANMIETEPNRAIFWAIGRTGRILHTGGDGGVSAFVSFNPKTSLGRIVFINTEIEDDLAMQNQFKDIVTELQKFEDSSK